MAQHPSRQIRPKYTPTTLTVYQASSSIADAAVDIQALTAVFPHTHDLAQTLLSVDGVSKRPGPQTQPETRPGH
ncbi:hypothetical protein CDV55_104098 [Aspergillus turcosus]|nr:hypothetical protein CDV55_104098 [Aspergillus turcosus]